MVHTMMNTLGTPVRAKEERKEGNGQRTQGEFGEGSREGGGREKGGRLGLLPPAAQVVHRVKTSPSYRSCMSEGL